LGVSFLCLSLLEDVLQRSPRSKTPGVFITRALAAWGGRRHGADRRPSCPTGFLSAAGLPFAAFGLLLFGLGMGVLATLPGPAPKVRQKKFKYRFGRPDDLRKRKISGSVYFFKPAQT